MIDRSLSKFLAWVCLPCGDGGGRLIILTDKATGDMEVGFGGRALHRARVRAHITGSTLRGKDPFLPPEMSTPSLGTQTVEVRLSGGRGWAGGGGRLLQLQPSLGPVFYTVSNISSEKVSGLVLLLGRLRCREGRCYIEGPGQWGISIARLAAVGPLEPRVPIFMRCGQEVA